MYKVSDTFAAAMANHPYSAKITLDNGVVIQSNPANREDPINEITFRGGANSNSEGFTLGGTVSAAVELVLNKEKVNCEFAGRQITVELMLNNEALPMGVYYVTDPRADDDLLTVTACDALGTKFEREYEPLDGFSFDVGVSSIDFLRALCERRGVEVDTSNLIDVSLKVSPDGFTERQIIGFIAALNGGFAVIDRNGVLRVRSYTQCNAKVTPDSYYEGGLEKADYTFSVQWIKCYNEAVDLTMVMGDMAASQGIYLESIWMTNEILMKLWDQLQGFSYVPVMELSFFGNPLIDVGDIITLEDLSGATIMIPVMRITNEYDGGVITRVAANGQAETNENAGSVKSQIQRAASRAKQYTDLENEKLNQLELLKRLTNEWIDDGIYLTDKGKIAFKASAILSGVLMASLIQTGILQSNDGKTFYLDLDKGILKMKASELSVSGKTVEQIAEEKANDAKNAAAENLKDYAETVTAEIGSLQSQIDGQIQTWFYSYIPTTSNAPASSWTTTEQKNQHLGDLFYIVENETNGGLVYRWALVNGSYRWQLVEDVEVAKALQEAAKAKDTADGKRRVFVSQPVPPYDVGDLWAQGASGDLMRCNTARASGSYVASDWGLASKYIDESKAGTIAQGKVDAQTQEYVFNKLTNNGTLQGFYMQDGKLYINAEFVKILNLIANSITSGALKSKDGTTVFDLDNGEIYVTAPDYKNRKVRIKGGKISVIDGNGKERITISPQEDYSAVWFSNPSGAIIGGFQGGSTDDFWVYCKDLDSGNLSGRKVGWKTIKDANGSLVTCLAAY